MRKRFIAVLASMLCLAMAASAAAACSGDNNQGDNTQGDGTQTTQTNYTVTAAQWDSAFSATITNAKYTIDYGQTVMTAGYDSVKELYYSEMITEISQSGSSEVTYRKTYALLAKEGDNYYLYLKENDEDWIKTDGSNYIDSSIEQCKTPVTTIISGLEGLYSQFTFADNVYKAQDVEIAATETADEVTVRFEDGKLVSVTLKAPMQNDSEGAQSEIEILIGEANIQVPTDYVQQ